jgi:hypothetical protein
MENIRAIITFTFYLAHATNLPCISATFTGLSLFVAWVVFSLYPSSEFAVYQDILLFFAWELYYDRQSNGVLVLVS